MTKQSKGKAQSFVKTEGTSSGWVPNETGWYTIYAEDMTNEEALAAFRMATDGQALIKALLERRMGYPVNIKVRRHNISFTRNTGSTSKPRNVW